MQNRFILVSSALIALAASLVSTGAPKDVPLAHDNINNMMRVESLTPALIADAQSLVLKHIANITATLTEEYLRSSLSADLSSIVSNGSAFSQAGRIADLDAYGAVGETDEPRSASSESSAPPELLPLGWSVAEDVPSPANCICNCNNNPTTQCCIRICSQARVSPFENTAGSESCICNCNNNPTTACCIRICSQTSVASTKVSTDEAQTPVSGSNTIFREPRVKDFARYQDALDNDVPELTAQMTNVKLRASTGEMLAVEAGFDLGSYASFVSKDLVDGFHLASTLQPWNGEGTTTIVIKDLPCQIVGTVSLTLDGFGRQSLSLQDRFYVFNTDQEKEEQENPSIIFGIDHLRQLKSLKLDTEHFV